MRATSRLLSLPQCGASSRCLPLRSLLVEWQESLLGMYLQARAPHRLCFFATSQCGVQVMGADAAADKVEADLCKLINDGQSNYYG